MDELYIFYEGLFETFTKRLLCINTKKPFPLNPKKTFKNQFLNRVRREFRSIKPVFAYSRGVECIFLEL